MNIVQPFASLEECFGDLPDPRVVGRCDHALVEIIMVAVCGVLSGAESWSEMEEFGEAKAAWLKQYLEFPAGIPVMATCLIRADCESQIAEIGR